MIKNARFILSALQAIALNNSWESFQQRHSSIKLWSVRPKSATMGFHYTYLIVWSVFESVLCTCPIFGWAQLLEILQNERYFSSYCEDETNSNQTNTSYNVLHNKDINTCSKQDSILNLAYTISVFVSFASVFLSGKYMDLTGFRKTRILARYKPILLLKYLSDICRYE